MSTRYCPSCDLAGLSPYTQWRAWRGHRLSCMGDTSDEHEAYIDRGQYHFLFRGYRRTAPATDDGIICFGAYHRGDIFAQMCLAMEQEFITGIFVLALWAPTFPQPQDLPRSIGGLLRWPWLTISRQYWPMWRRPIFGRLIKDQCWLVIIKKKPSFKIKNFLKFGAPHFCLQMFVLKELF